MLGSTIKFIVFVTCLIVTICIVDCTSGVANAASYNNRDEVPRTKEGLKEQLGPGFLIYSKQNYIIATDLEKNVADYVVNGVFDNCRRILSSQFFNKKASDIVTIYIFKDKISYTHGLKAYFNMDPISPYGHYGHTQRYIVINYSTGPGTLVHELTHSLMAIDFPSAPIWISEGVASLFEQCKVEDGFLKGEQNWRLPELHRGIETNRLTPLKLLFKSDTKVFRMLRESLHYAECRYFCKYLEDRGLLERVYKTFRDNVKNNKTGIDIVEMAFGKDIDSIEKDWIDWVKLQEWNGNGYKD